MIKIEQKKIGTWVTNIGPIRHVPKEIVHKLEVFLTTEWLPTALEVVEKPWWSVRELNIISPIIRVDMAPTNEQEIKEKIYEVEHRPAGLGMYLSLVPEKKSQWRKAVWCCKGFVNYKTEIQDDPLAALLLGLPYYNYEKEGKSIDFNREPYWIRTSLREGEFIEKFEKISLVPLSSDGNKSDLVKLGLARPVRVEEINWEEGFVVKPLVGTRMKGVEIYLPPRLREKYGEKGVSTRTRVMRRIELGVPYILQEFIPPFCEEINGVQGWTIWRLFFVWERDGYRFGGGCWNWKPELRVHGASNAIFGCMNSK